MSTLRTNTIQDTGTNTAMTISGGTVSFNNAPLTSTRPAFAVRGFGSLDSSATVNSISIPNGVDIIYNYDSIDINRGSAFSNSTGKYTVPTAGLYQVHAGFGFKSSTNYIKLILYLTSNDDSLSGHISGWSLNDGQHYNTQLSTIVEASANQEFALGMSDTYSTPYTDKWYLWFSAYLIG